MLPATSPAISLARQPGDTPVTGPQGPTLAPTSSAPTKKPTPAPTKALASAHDFAAVVGDRRLEDTADAAGDDEVVPYHGQGYGMITRGCCKLSR
jgi:hypothetical protein